MATRFSYASKQFLLGALILVVIGASRTSARAGDVTLALQMMIEDQGADNITIATLFGNDTGASISYTSFIDPSGESFSYNAVAGSTYLGQALTLSATATSDTTSTNWTFSSSVSLGGSSFSMDGTGTILADGSNTDEGSKKTKDKDGNITGDIHWTSEGDSDKYTKTDKSGGDVGSGSAKSSKGVFKGFWSMSVIPDFPDSDAAPPALSITGFSPLGGGNGSFTTTFVPEPPSVALLSLGVLALLARIHRNRRKNEDVNHLVAT